MSQFRLAYVDPHFEERLSLVSDEDELEDRGTGVKSPVAWAPGKYEIATSAMYKPK